MKTIALKEPTWERLKRTMQEEKAENFNELIERLLKKAENVPKTMFGVDKDSKSYTLREHEEFQRDYHE